MGLFFSVFRFFLTSEMPVDRNGENLDYDVEKTMHTQTIFLQNTLPGFINELTAAMYYYYGSGAPARRYGLL